MKRAKQLTTYCYECDDFVEYVEKNVKKTLEVRGVKITCIITECFCKQCGEPVFVEYIEKANEIKVYDLYKKHVGLLTSEEIKQILEKRHMKQKELAAFLSIGEKDITRYLNGSIQSKNIDKMLRLVNDDEAYARMVEVFEGKHIIFVNCTRNIISSYVDTLGTHLSSTGHAYKESKLKGGINCGRQNNYGIA